VVIALGGVGAMVGSVLAPRLVRRFGLGATFLGSAIVQGVSTFFIPLAGVAPAFAVACLMVPQLFGDMAFMVYMINEISVRQTVAPEQVLGRVNAGMQLLARGIWPIGALLGGALAALLGVRTTLAISASGVLLSAVWLLAPRVRRLR
jgi:predicted MFS family arabinose efflux permease